MVMKSRQEIKEEAKLRVRDNGGNCIAAYLLALLAGFVVTSVTVSIGAWLVVPVIAIAIKAFFLRVYLGDILSPSQMFTGMFDNYGRKLGAYWWSALWQFLWSLLFVIPGMIKAIAYMFVPYIVATHPEVTAKSALILSDRMTRGYKMDLFITALSFFGWELLSGLTFGILEVVYVGPYRETTFAGIYAQLERNALENGTITNEQLEGEMIL